ncbi:MAG TPA: hypothetical protein VKB19_20530 [Pedobacter sp.]|nr:hypothetical protein [Pedobacter sp.]
MDRLIIESTLSDVNEIFLSEKSDARPNRAIILGFKASNTDQVINAFSALKEIAQKSSIELIVCKTSQTGIYDLQIKTEALDEPIRIENKVISHETLGGIEDHVGMNDRIILGTNVSEEENWIIVHTARIKDCELKHQ